MVARALPDTSGNTWSNTSPLEEPIPPFAGFSESAATELAGGGVLSGGCTFSLVAFKDSGAVGCAGFWLACAIAGAAGLVVSETFGSVSDAAFGFETAVDCAGFCAAGWLDGFSELTVAAG